MTPESRAVVENQEEKSHRLQITLDNNGAVKTQISFEPGSIVELSSRIKDEGAELEVTSINGDEARKLSFKVGQIQPLDNHTISLVGKNDQSTVYSIASDSQVNFHFDSNTPISYPIQHPDS